MNLHEKIDQIPSHPGVYLMKNAEGTILYIGKAKNLRNRVRSYFRKAGGDGRYQIRFLIPAVQDIDVLITDTEKEALILENNLIKEHRPRYNIYLRDDKEYVHLRLDPHEEWPKLTVVRRPQKDGSLYFGPYASSNAVRETLRSVYKLFPIRSCSDTVFKNRKRPCLYYQIHRCVGPCVEGLTTKEEYDELVSQVTLLLRGSGTELIKRLKEQMHEASEALRFEEAGRIYRRIQAIAQTVERQKVTSVQLRDQDVFGYYREGERVTIQKLVIRQGKLLGSATDTFRGQLLPDAEILSSYLNQSYAEISTIPQEILLPYDIEDREVLEELLAERKGKKIEITIPQRGEKQQLVLMANKNARMAFQKDRDQQQSLEDILAGLQQKLHLKNLPRRIECFDISNILGTHAVGSMVTFQDGKPDKKRYRRFKIKTVQGADDYAMMTEVLGRRYRRALEEDDLPDLIMVDGGKGQLNIALSVLWELGLEEPDLISIAKSRVRSNSQGKVVERTAERIFLPERKNPVTFSSHSPLILLLQQIRDEAHRFAVSYHKQVRNRSILHSPLDEIPGIGEKRKQQLLRHFGSLKKIQEASREELEEVEGITRPLAERVFAFFQKSSS